jgi:hypothetical protein
LPPGPIDAEEIGEREAGHADPHQFQKRSFSGTAVV